MVQSAHALNERDSRNFSYAIVLVCVGALFRLQRTFIPIPALLAPRCHNKEVIVRMLLLMQLDLEVELPGLGRGDGGRIRLYT
ncbi:hypothetical protein V8D89_009837 [Ganoderma adspersum]